MVVVESQSVHDLAAAASSGRGIRLPALGSSVSAPVLPTIAGGAPRRTSVIHHQHSTSSLSEAVQRANREVGEKVSRLTSLDRASAPDRQSLLPQLPPVRGGTLRDIPAKADVIEDIRMLLKDAGKLWNEGLSAAAAPAATVNASSAKLTAKAESNKPTSKRKPKKFTGSGEQPLIAPRSEATAYVRATLAELRSNPDKMEAFAARVAEMTRPPPDKRIVEINAKAFASLSSTDFVEGERQRQAERLEECKARRSRVLLVRDEAEEQRVAQVVAHAGRWEQAHAARLRREKKAALYQRQEAWLTAIVAARQAQILGDALVRRQELKVRLAAQLKGAKSFAIAWRICIMRRRLRALVRVRRLIRRRFFFWRMKRNIEAKRRASVVLIDYMKKMLTVSRPHRLIRQYAHAVRRIQGSWRQVWLAVLVQVEANRVAWIEADMARGLSSGAASNVEQHDRDLRLILIREELRERKAQHAVMVRKWVKQKKEYDEYALPAAFTTAHCAPPPHVCSRTSTCTRVSRIPRTYDIHSAHLP